MYIVHYVSKGRIYGGLATRYTITNPPIYIGCWDRETKAGEVPSHGSHISTQIDIWPDDKVDSLTYDSVGLLYFHLILDL